MTQSGFKSPYLVTPVPGDQTDAIRTVYFDPHEVAGLGIEWSSHVLANYVLKWCTVNPIGPDQHVSLVIYCDEPPAYCNYEAANRAWQQAIETFRYRGSPVHLSVLCNPQSIENALATLSGPRFQTYGRPDDPHMIAAMYDSILIGHFGDIATDMIKVFTTPRLKPASDDHFRWRHLEDRIARGSYQIAPQESDNGTETVTGPDWPYEVCFLRGRHLDPSIYRIEHGSTYRKD